MLRSNIIIQRLKFPIRTFAIGFPKNAESSSDGDYKRESPRMKKFHEQLKLERVPRVGPSMRFVDLVLVDTDQKGELIPNSEKNPTKWGDWQHGGRVTDF